MSVDAIVANFKNDFHRPNRFRVEISFPIQVGDVSKSEELTNYVKSTNFPFFTLTEGIMEYNNEKHKFAVGKDLDPVSITFYVDGKGSIIETFTSWYKLVRGENGFMNFKNEYTGDILISMNNKKNLSIRDAVLINAYPVNISEIPLDYSSRSAVSEITVTFNYDYVDYL